MKKFLFTLVLLFNSVLLIGQKINYKLKMPNPQSHYFEVEMILEGFKEKQLELKMPVWAPGSYLVREFSKNVNQVLAFDENKTAIKTIKTAKNTWQLQNASKGKKIIIKYEVYAFELSVRTSFLDLTHGFVSGSGVFMYVNSHQQLPGQLEIIPYYEFKVISTALPLSTISISSDGSKVFDFLNYDHLVDCPIEIGNQVEFQFMASGVKHTVAMYGDGNFDVDKLKVDMPKVIEAETQVFGENPNKDYLFIVHNVVDGQGGLEHMNSTTLSVNRWSYSGADYLGFLNLVAHEYFHLWNVKRFRPIELGPFDYDKENYTSLLWVMEGFTSYYDELIMRRAGLMSQEEFISKIQNSINYVEGSVGSRVQSVAHASFDAWIKAYRPNENSSNTTMTYYSRGQIIAAVFDLMIVDKYKGKKCLDDFMRYVYVKYAKELKRGITDQEFKQELEKFLEMDLAIFYAKYIDGTEIIPYAEYFSKVGIDVIYSGSKKPSFGASVRQEGGNVIVKNVRSGSSAEMAGISVNDEIIACNGFRVNQGSLESTMNALKENGQVELLLSRDDILFSVNVKIAAFEKPYFTFTTTKNEDKKALRNYWLR
ncbi:MAG: PDZ domain-containing protein [Crocinitomicaceae bacterium]|nr:PDZ domain-containing protein [Crocinitomicaceae bacterium]